MGYDAHLLYSDDIPHFLPHNDTFSLEYQNYSKVVRWESLYTDNSIIEKDLEGFDIIIGCGFAPRFCYKVGRKVNIMYPYGGDIYNVILYSGNIKKEIILHYFKSRIKKYFGININFRESKYRYAMEILFQKKALEQVDFFISPRTNDSFDRFFDVMNAHSKWIKSFSPVIYLPLYDPNVIREYFNRSNWYLEFKKIREKNDIVIFHHARHIWKTPKNPFENKANDRLIRAFSKFVKMRKDLKSHLILFEYSRDFYETKKLIFELGIEDMVTWFPLLPRKEIMIGINQCDLGATEFENSWVIGGVICEFLAMGKIFIGCREDKFYERYYPELYPILNAKTEDEIFAQLCYYADNKEECDKLGQLGYQWHKKYMVEEPLKILKDLLKKYEN
ncbi:MAG: hypothetical protein N2110_00015 [Flavobacteriales bacterium]|nr:hypothetical protein [Flavobacteriales bacterium]